MAESHLHRMKVRRTTRMIRPVIHRGSRLGRIQIFPEHLRAENGLEKLGNLLCRNRDRILSQKNTAKENYTFPKRITQFLKRIWRISIKLWKRILRRRRPKNTQTTTFASTSDSKTILKIVLWIIRSFCRHLRSSPLKFHHKGGTPARF